MWRHLAAWHFRADSFCVASPAAASSSPPQPTAAAAPLADLLGGDDLLSGLGGMSLDAPAAAAPPPPRPPLQLQPSPVLSPAEFQGKWGSLQPVSQFSQQLSPGALSMIQPTGQQVRPRAWNGSDEEPVGKFWSLIGSVASTLEPAEEEKEAESDVMLGQQRGYLLDRRLRCSTVPSVAGFLPASWEGAHCDHGLRRPTAKLPFLLPRSLCGRQRAIFAGDAGQHSRWQCISHYQKRCSGGPCAAVHRAVEVHFEQCLA